jgi:hypothetical protein
MEVANTLAYYDTATITAVKSFIVQAPEVKLLNYFLNSFIRTKLVIPSGRTI